MKNTLGVLLLCLWMTAVSFGQPATRPASAPMSLPATTSLDGPAAVVEVSGAINDFTAMVMEKHFAAARAAGAKTILLQLDTPGGAVVSALQMSQFIKKQRSEGVRVVAVVHNMALSAGAMLAVACERIVMEPGSMLGDCAPILMGPQGLQTLGEAERAKMESPILAEFFDSAQRSGYDPLLVSAMVQYGIVVHYLESPDGERRFVKPDDATKLKAEGWHNVEKVPDPLDGANQLLTVTSDTAARIGLAQTTASAEAFAADNGLQLVGRFSTTLGEELVGLLSGAALRGLLGIVFMWSLYTAVTKPGTGVPETIAFVSGAVLLGVPLLTGYAGWFEFLLIITGIVLIAVELFVIPGFGFVGLTGVICLLLGFVLTFAPPELPGGGIWPQLQGTRTALKHGMAAVAVGLVVSTGLWFWLAKYLPQIPYMNRLVLTTNVGQTPEAGDERAAIEQAWPTVGESGTAVTRLAPGGVATFFDPIVNDQRTVDVVCDLGFVNAGETVVVREREGSRVVVRATTVPAAGA